MEIAPDIHRLEIPLGNRFVCIFLLVGSEGILVLDSGLDDSPSQYVAPYLEKLGAAPDDIRYVVNSHADMDHTGGNMSLREMVPEAVFMCHELDRPLVEDLELMISARYGEFAADHDIEDSEETKEWIRSSARHCPIDLGLTGGEMIRMGNDWHIKILFTPGHSRGHITLYDPRSHTAIITDTVLWNSIVTTEGDPAFPPTYRYVDSYISSINMLLSMPIDILLTSHYPVFRGAEVDNFLSESQAYVDRVDRTLMELLQGSKDDFTLREIIEALNTKLGDWPDGAEILLDFPLTGHLERLVQYRKSEDRASRPFIDVFLGKMSDNMPYKALTRESLAEQVANSLREHIYSSLEPGDYLPSTANLIEEYQVSRIVIREALKYLEAQDIIEIANGKRARVKPISANVLRTFFKRATSFDRKTLMELLEVRRGIEIESAGLAALRRTPQELARLQDIIEEMKRHLADPEPFSDLDFELHQIIAKATHNSMLIFLVETIHEAQRETILHGLYSQFANRYFLEIQDIHARIVGAISEQNQQKAQRAMKEHFEYAEKAVGYEIAGLTEEIEEA